MVGVSLVKSGDSRPARPAPAHAAIGDVEFRSGGDGGWVTWEPRGRVEGWLRESLRKGAYKGAAFYGMALRGELYG